MDIEEEVLLTGGRITQGVVRVGNTVRRPTGPHTPFVHSLLRHLEKVGFDGAPRALGIDERGREIVTFIEGYVPPNLATWSDGQLVEAAELIRRFHDATAGTELAAGEEIVCHNDLSPCNTVFLEGGPRRSSTSTWPLLVLAAKTWATRCGCSWTLVQRALISTCKDGASA